MRSVRTQRIRGWVEKVRQVVEDGLTRSIKVGQVIRSVAEAWSLLPNRI